MPELRQINVGVDEMKAAGYSATDLRDARVPAKELERAGYTAHQLKEGGYRYSTPIAPLVPLLPSRTC